MNTNLAAKQDFVVVVIPISEIKKFIAIDIIGGTALFYMIKLPLHSVLAGMIGSMIGPLIVRKSLQVRGSRKAR